MKNAILLAGHLRTFSTTKPKWEECSKDNQAEIYLHLWNTCGNRLDLQPGETVAKLGAYAPKTFDRNLIDPAICNEFTFIQEESVKESEFLKKVKPLEDQFIAKNLKPPSMAGIVSQWYKRYEGLKWLMSRDSSVDMVILSRPDFHIGAHAKAPLSRLQSSLLPLVSKFDLSSLDKDKTYFSWLHPSDGYNDLYLIGHPENLLKVCTIYQDGVDVFVNKYKDVNVKKLDCGHAFLMSWLETLSLKIEVVGLAGWIER